MTSRWLSISSTLVLSTLCGGTFLGSDPPALEVCNAAEHQVLKSARIRGVARLTDRGLLLGDLTCPVYDKSGTFLPTLLTVKSVSFVKSVHKREFERLRESMDRPIYQVLITGDLECKVRLSIEADAEGSPVRGSGFGGTGFVKCQMISARVLTFVRLR
jgi:hypothetical protein